MSDVDIYAREMADKLVSNLKKRLIDEMNTQSRYEGRRYFTPMQVERIINKILREGLNYD